MKKIISLLLTSYLLLLPFGSFAADFSTRARAAFLMDFDSGAEIVAKESDTLLPPSSMVKLMTLAVVFDALKSGDLTMDENLVVSDAADYRNSTWAQASKICLARGQEIKTSDAIAGLIVVSGGDAGVVLAERLAGSENDFTTQMLKKARAIGMPLSSFGNVSGLPSPDNLMTARELAILGSHLIKEYPEYYPMFSARRFEFKDYASSWCQQWGDLHAVSYNKLLFTMPGADGMKTGHTESGGFGMVASAQRGGRRLIGVLNGLRVKDHNALASEMKKMLEWGFANTTSKTFFRAGEVVANIPVWYGRQDSVQATAAENVAITLMSGQSMSDVRILARYNDPVPAPIRAGDILGEIIVERSGETIATIPMLAKTNVNKTQFFGRIIRNLGVIFGGK